MHSSLFCLALLSTLLHPYVSAGPITRVKLVHRDETGPIYGSSGKPQMTDVDQGTNPDCGFASVLAAVVDVSSEWISSQVTYTPSIQQARSATVTLHNFKEGTAGYHQPKQFTIQCSETEHNSDINPETDVWWPGLYNHAAIKLGFDTTNGALGPVFPAAAMYAITGFEAVYQDKEKIGHANNLLDLCSQRKIKNSPMIFQTVEGARTLVGSHAYAILSTNGRDVTLYNPWGSSVTHPVDAIWNDLIYVFNLKDWNTFSSQSVNSNTDSDTPRPAVSSAPKVNPSPAPKISSEAKTNTLRQRPRPTDVANVNLAQGGGGNGKTTFTETKGNMVIVNEIVTVTAGADPKPQVTEVKDQPSVVIVEEVVTVTKWV